MSDLNRYYRTLEIKVGSSQAEVKQAYRKLAKIWHPDRFSGDPVLQQQAEEKLKAINEAYQHLKDYQPPEPTPPDRPARPSQPTSTGVSTRLTSAEKCYERASEYGRDGQYKEALEELSLAIRLNPDYAQAYRYRGFVHSMLGFELGAEADLRKAKDLEWEQAYTARKAKRQAEKASSQRASAPPKSPPSPSAAWTCLQTLTEHQDGITTIALSGDGRVLASGSRDRTIKLWNLPTGKILGTLSGHTAAVTAIALSADGTLLISSSEDQTLRFWNLKTGTLLRTLTSYEETFTTLALSGDRNLLVGCGRDGYIHFWRLSSNPIAYETYAQEAPVLSIALSRNGQQVISGSSNHRVAIQQARTGELLGTWSTHFTVVTALALNPVDGSFAAGGEDGTLQWWRDQITPAESSSHLLTGHQGAITTLCFTPKGHSLISGSRDHTLRMWHPYRRELLSTLTGHTNVVTSAIASPKSELIISSSLDSTIKLWGRSQKR